MPVRESYATGSVEGDENVGGLTGTNVPPPDPEGSYWDVPATGQEESDGGTGLSNIADDPPADEMTGEDVTTYMDGFDFTGTWETVVDPDDYPVLVALDRDEQLTNRA